MLRNDAGPEWVSWSMRRFKTGTIVLLTALVTALITSIFWIAAYNWAGEPQPAAEEAIEPRSVITRKAAPDMPAPVPVLAPSGLAVPVAGVEMADLIDTYTAARAGGTRVHDAIDIMAPHGTPVIAAAPGTVEKLFYSEGGGGVTVYVRSPDRRWIHYYAHLQHYAPGLREGQAVERGEVLGTVGSSGNASPDAPHLHFAVHRVSPEDDWHGGEPVNPYPLLAG